MAQNDNIIFFQFLFGKPVQTGFLPLPDRFRDFCFAAGAGEEFAEIKSNVRVNYLEYFHHEFIADQLAENLVAKIVRSKAVTMRDEYFFAVDSFGKSVGIDFAAEFITQKIPEPEIMITGNKNDAAAVFLQVGKFFQDREISFDHNGFPDEPDVENITVQDE